ncbi:MAG: filamentous hemagglutinin N-terminal domain-containing protein, partial [Candidatus Omnitrophica bacterium]|nr:filamentous hemagglutinin N-terminal domain-containing protein [Candidatus Omnitrophota bacterium]
MKGGKFVSRLMVLIAAGGLLFPMQALPLPNNPQVVAGESSVTQAGSQMTVTQTTNRAVINWQGYSIGQGESVRYDQPGASAVSLNRVVGQDPSTILGQLLANGQVFLINPNGIVFGPTSVVNVAGLLATTMNISDADFMAGNYFFAQDPNTALSYIINKGTITVGDNGYVVLVAPLVSNEGLIVANLGKVVIGGAESFTVNFDGTGLVNFAISTPLEGTPGTVLIPTSQVTDIVRQVVNTPGLIEAGAIIEENGVTRLVAASGTAINSGTIQALDGSVVLKSTQAAVLSDGATMDAGTGHFEISAPNFLLRGTTIGGSGLIDPTNLYVVPDTTATQPNEVNETYIESQSVAGTHVVYDADDLISITDLSVGSDGVITGGSGNITFRISDDGDNAG